MLIDYHMHLEEDGYRERCRFNVERVRTYVEAARARGIDEIGVTEHAHRFRQFGHIMKPMLKSPGTPPKFAAWADESFNHDLTEYAEAILAAKEEGLPVKLGLEVDWIPGQAEAIADMLAPYPWDFVLGSVHFLGNWPVDYSPDVGWPERDVDAVYEEYCRTLAEMARTGLFHVLAHLDLVKKFGHRPRSPMKDAWQTVIEAAVEGGCCVEISTAGLRKPVGEIYPAEDLLRSCREAGLPITLASDAHNPEDVGYAVEEAVAWAQRCGYDQIAVFSRGEYRLEPIGARR